ncbi:hypothetical protein G7054_g14182 [Neopestalotiopsis clavispora]|nr:hypothetical protein G7054_g14182 [Neopestalotiopsis clavispora]
MAASEETSFLSGNVVLITGGSGGLASQILRVFLRVGCAQLHSLDTRQPSCRLDGVTYYTADLTDSGTIRRIFQQVRPGVVIHAASPHFAAPDEIMLRVNVEGTKDLVQIAKEFGTHSFVYTSSASVVSDGKTDLVNADETYPVILDDTQPEFYVYTKALAERIVLSQNSRTQNSTQQFLTCAIRPSGIFGVGDLVVLPGILDAYFRGQTKVQIGGNQNLFDFTDNRNVAHAHYLAAVALVRSQNQLPDDNVRVDGEAFLVTNDEPICFWSFTRRVWRYAGDVTQPDEIWVIPRGLALLLAWVLEWVFWALGMESPLTRTKVRLSCLTRYFCINKAKSRLGYEPLVGLEEGLREAVKDSLRRRE